MRPSSTQEADRLYERRYTLLGLRKRRQIVILGARCAVSTFSDPAELHAKEISEPGDERP